MRQRFELHALPPLSVLGTALFAGLIEWVALWRSRRRRRADPPSSF